MLKKPSTHCFPSVIFVESFIHDINFNVSIPIEHTHTHISNIQQIPLFILRAFLRPVLGLSVIHLDTCLTQCLTKELGVGMINLQEKDYI